MVHPGGLLALRLALRAVAKATLSSLVPAVSTATSPIPSSLKVTENMVHPGGFEPPTARFVAEYSIQLSYGCKMAVRRGFEPRMQLLTAYSLSRGAPSASRPPHHTPLTSASKNLFLLFVAAMAHILLSGTYKSNTFSRPFFVCTLRTQFACKNGKKGNLSTGNQP